MLAAQPASGLGMISALMLCMDSNNDLKSISSTYESQPGIARLRPDSYCRMFCSTRRRDRHLLRKDDSWITCKHRWDENLILRHLEGEIIIGLFPANYIDYLMFDIDNHEPGLTVSPQERCRLVLPLFEVRPLVYTSSDSGGLRVCYFLDQRYPRAQVYQFAERKMTGAAVEVRPGFIEIMATGVGDRLPFGRGSTLVDPETLLPIPDIPLEDKIKSAWSIFLESKLRIALAPTDPVELGQPKPRFVDIVDSLLENGLPPGDVMTTNEALMKLNWDLMGRRGYGADDAKRHLKSWISNHHNGHSNDINSGRIEEVYAHIDRIVGRFDPDRVRFQGLAAGSSNERLTLHDAEVILHLFDSYRHQLAAFSLLLYTKERGKLIDTRQDIGKRNTAISYSMSNYNVSGFVQVWLCAIPQKAFLKFPGFNKTNPKVTRRVLEEKGLIKLHELEDRAANQCRKYKIYFNFSNDSEAVVSLDEALLKLRSKQQLIVDYGRRRVNHIRKESEDLSGNH
jgi:hypothetical protein